jgi:hypothetical protein
MTTSEIISRLRQYGVEVVLAGDRLKLQAPAVPPAEALALVEQLKARKPEALAALLGQSGITEGCMLAERADPATVKAIEVLGYRVKLDPPEKPQPFVFFRWPGPGLPPAAARGLFERLFGWKFSADAAAQGEQEVLFL